MSVGCDSTSAEGSRTSSRRAQGSGLGGEVHTLAAEGANFYVGGLFTDTGGIANADYITRWGPSCRVYLPMVRD